MKKLVLAVVLGIALTEFGETVTNVRGLQRPNSNLVDIYYDLDAVDGWSYTVTVRISGRTDAVSATTFSGDVGKGIAPGKNRHIVWEAGADWRGKKGDVKAIVTATIETKKSKRQKVQLWEGGPYWADRNIGADAPWEYGLYFWWGDTKGHRPSGATFGFSFTSSNCPTFGKTFEELRSQGWTSDGRLAPRHDAAHVKWGGAGRIPSNSEISNLRTKCTWTWTTMNGVKGHIVRGKGDYASKSIFLPAAGHGDGSSFLGSGAYGGYWAANPISTAGAPDWVRDYTHAAGFWFYQSTFYSSPQRHLGQSIRPVQ